MLNFFLSLVSLSSHALAAATCHRRLPHFQPSLSPPHPLSLQLREEWEPKVKEVYGFSSAKKMASVLVEMPHGLRLYNKGAAEWVLKRCTRMIVPGGGVAPMTDADRDNLVQVGGSASHAL
jgi:magnesium-transporting ATPase (P-type)